MGKTNYSSDVLYFCTPVEALKFFCCLRCYKHPHFLLHQGSDVSSPCQPLRDVNSKVPVAAYFHPQGHVDPGGAVNSLLHFLGFGNIVFTP